MVGLRANPTKAPGAATNPRISPRRTSALLTKPTFRVILTPGAAPPEEVTMGVVRGHCGDGRDDDSETDGAEGLNSTAGGSVLSSRH